MEFLSLYVSERRIKLTSPEKSRVCSRLVSVLFIQPDPMRLLRLGEELGSGYFKDLEPDQLTPSLTKVTEGVE